MSILQRFDLKKSIEIVNLQDEAGYTLLHSAAYYNTYKIADYIISFFKRRLATFLKQRLLRKKDRPLSLQSNELSSSEIETIRKKVTETLR